MKRKLILGLAIFAVPAFCGLIPGLPDIVFDPSSYGQIVQDVRAAVQLLQEEQQIRQEAMMAYGMMTSPGGWKIIVANAAQTAGSRLSSRSTGSDLAAIAQLAEGRQSALAAMRQIANDPRYQPTAENAATISLLHLQAINATRDMNELQTRLDYQAQVKQYQAQDQGFAGAVEDMTAWHLQQ
jgi:hypothetical protein